MGDARSLYDAEQELHKAVHPLNPGRFPIILSLSKTAPNLLRITEYNPIRYLHLQQKCTLIILTSFSRDEITDEALHIGADSIPAKPLSASNVTNESERTARKDT